MRCAWCGKQGEGDGAEWSHLVLPDRMADLCSLGCAERWVWWWRRARED